MPPRKRKKKAAAAKKEEGEEPVEAEAEAEEPAAKKQETEAGEEPALVHVVSSSEPAPAPEAPPLDAEVASLLASAREAVAPQPSVAAAAWCERRRRPRFFRARGARRPGSSYRRRKAPRRSGADRRSFDVLHLLKE